MCSDRPGACVNGEKKTQVNGVKTVEAVDVIVQDALSDALYPSTVRIPLDLPHLSISSQLYNASAPPDTPPSQSSSSSIFQTTRLKSLAHRPTSRTCIAKQTYLCQAHSPSSSSSHPDYSPAASPAPFAVLASPSLFLQISSSDPSNHHRLHLHPSSRTTKRAMYPTTATTTSTWIATTSQPLTLIPATTTAQAAAAILMAEAWADCGVFRDRLGLGSGTVAEAFVLAICPRWKTGI